MQSVLRSAARRAVGAGSRRGFATTTTTTEATKEWVAQEVQREVRSQMLAAAEKRAAVERARAAEWRARHRALKLELEVPWRQHRTWRMGFWMGYLSCIAGAGIATLLQKR